MKKTLVTLFAIAIIGLIGVVDKTQGSSHQLVSPSNTGAAVASSGSQSSTSTSAGSTATASYKSGTFTGNSEQTPYGTVQMAVVITGGKITDINFLQMPSDLSSSRERTQYSEPLLKQTTIAKQSANIDFVSGATSTSEGYQMSLQSALDQASGTQSSQTQSSSSNSSTTTQASPFVNYDQ